MTREDSAPAAPCRSASQNRPPPKPATRVQEAGAVISDAVGNPLDFSHGRFFPHLHGGIVAATPTMHAAIVAAIHKIRGGQQQQQQQQQGTGA